jgi:site-specific DNA-methyltransferase (adenine-specific)
MALVKASGPGWEVVCGDCMDPTDGMPSVPDGHGATVLTDPPYHDRVLAGARSLGSRPEERRLCGLSVIALHNAGLECLRIARKWAIFFSSAEEAHLWQQIDRRTYFRTGIWDKTNATPQLNGQGPAQAHETIVIHHKSGKWNGGGRSAKWSYPTEQGKNRPDHPCPKPLKLIEQLIRDFSNRGDLIIDPFMGSGTTGVAAISLGRRFLGWEIEPGYFQTATDRLLRTREQIDLFGTVKPCEDQPTPTSP